jgi:predicted KAP-like P-loop ATPase
LPSNPICPSVGEIDRQAGIGKAPQDLWERALFVLRSEYRQALKTGSFRNDATQDEDLLNLKDEINALSEMLLMRDLEPPVVVGILGGWGGGKSYIMHLMQTHMVAVRSQGMEAIEAWGLKDDDSKSPDSDRVNRYVGHIYQIKFDAWTYAKSNLWASLMQTIFFELDRQVSLEMSLKDIGIDPLHKDGNKIWQVLYKTNEDDRQYFLEKVLGKDRLEKLKEKIKNQTDRKESWTELLWEQYGVTEIEASTHLEITKKELQEVEKELAKKETEKKNTLDNINNQKKPGHWISEILTETTNLSGFLLKRYFDKNIAEDLQKEIENKLKAEEVDISDLKKMNAFINKAVAEILDEDRITLPNGSTKYSLSRLALQKWLKKNQGLIIIFVLLIFGSIIFPLIIRFFDPQNIISQLAVLIAPLIPAIGFAQNLFRSNQKWLTQAKQSVKEYQETLKTRSEDKYHNLVDEKITNELRQLDVELNRLNLQKQSLAQEVENAKNALPKDKFASLASFVSARVKDAAYENQLGVMHQVKQDLTKLSQALLPPPSDSEEYKEKLNKLKRVFPRGPARVFLYIDDLDRCPPNTVVEVLEAVQLLVKNPLFIAVLAIDERYINRALAQQYKGVLSLQGSPSAADYLEKIIQIPYRVRPISEDALRTYLRAQTVVQDSETSGTKFNEFSPQEFNRLVTCCQEVELSPRSIKRLINVYKLYKILSRTRGQRPTAREQQAILALLTFSSRYPNLMREILKEIGSHYEEGQHLTEQDKPETLANIFNISLDKYKNISQASHLAQDAKKLSHDVKQLVADDLKLKEIREIFDFVRAFSFVGDIGVDITESGV